MAMSMERKKTDENGLPLVYDPLTIKKYWDSRPGEMTQRWTFFLGQTVPFITRLARCFSSGQLLSRESEIARDLRIIIENLGPTFIKLGQALSIRPDVIGPAATAELAKLQDAVPPFPSDEAYLCIEKELGRPLAEVFSEIAPEPAGSASLAQVYRAVLRSNGEAVAVKIQRPGLLPIVTRDLYVMKRAVETYQGLSERWTKQTTDYRELLQVWANGFYMELDFLNEANNQARMRDVLADVPDVYVPAVYHEFTTRRLLITEWIDGVKLTQVPPAEVKELTRVAQEAFLKQLLEVGFFHGDPHPGNLIRLSDQSKGRLGLIDFGLMASLSKQDMDVMVNALIHTANKDFPRLVDDLIELNVLPPDTDRLKVEPIMRRVIGPYVFQGGGAKNLNYQSLAADLGRATLEIPFNIPSYFALVARALGILEGIALTGDPDYKIVLEAYPYVTRRITTDDSPLLRRALQDILYSRSTADGTAAPALSITRLANLLTYAMGNTDAAAGGGPVFVDFDSVPSTGAKLNEVMGFLLGDSARSLRKALIGEIASATDLVLRQTTRRGLSRLEALLQPPPPPLPFLPRLPSLLLPVPKRLLDALSPQLSIEEEIFAKSLTDLGLALLGVDADSAAALDSGRPDVLLRKLLSADNSSAQELLEFARTVQADSPQGQALMETGQEVFNLLVARQQERLDGLLGRQQTGTADAQEHAAPSSPVAYAEPAASAPLPR
eukprot:TRINITY_DN4064_c0_g1_i4.p1 TRINITY_DN4064_c0_g1~~TRINITY_DN4064_c0_g1_i4.p1  ORF type:complete len:723 (+),score=280.48 TRINITY_DN4064_c0_g1_i4:457-2625(+)